MPPGVDHAPARFSTSFKGSHQDCDLAGLDDYPDPEPALDQHAPSKLEGQHVATICKRLTQPSYAWYLQLSRPIKRLYCHRSMSGMFLIPGMSENKVQCWSTKEDRACQGFKAALMDVASGSSKKEQEGFKSSWHRDQRTLAGCCTATRAPE